MIKDKKIEEPWDKKKIAIALMILLGLIAGLIYFSGVYKVKGENTKESKAQLQKAVEGAVEDIDVPTVKETIQEKIEEIKTDASNIDVVEVASSSPQVQKIINDIKSLENYPRNQAKDMCEKICDSF